MIERRDSKGHFIRGNVSRNKRLDNSPSRIILARAGLVPGNMIGGGVLKLERVQVICPACGQQIEAITRDSQVKEYCVVAK